MWTAMGLWGTKVCRTVHKQKAGKDVQHRDVLEEHTGEVEKVERIEKCKEEIGIARNSEMGY